MKMTNEKTTDIAASALTDGLGVLTPRDCFAINAMRSLIESNDPEYWWMNSTYSNLAKYSYKIADAMIKRRGNTPNVQIEAPDAALSRQVASNAGLGVAPGEER